MSGRPANGQQPGPHPLPPADLSDRRLPIRTFNLASWHRIHRCALDPLFFGDTVTYRFDAPVGEYGVLYCARTQAGAFIEVFGSQLGVGPARNTLDRKAVVLRCWTRVEAHRPLHLVDLTGRGLAAIGADERLCAGDYDVSRRWSEAFYDHPSAPDGIYYRARHDPSQRSVALFDRVERNVMAQPGGTLLTDAVLLAQMLRRYQIDLIG